LYVGGAFQLAGNTPASSIAQWVDITGIKELTNPVSIRVFPNPFSNTATIELNAAIPLAEQQFELYDVTGRMVQSALVQGSSFELRREDLQAGMYFFRLLANGKFVASGKLIVQ
jgi:hypothetical protein